MGRSLQLRSYDCTPRVIAETLELRYLVSMHWKVPNYPDFICYGVTEVEELSPEAEEESIDQVVAETRRVIVEHFGLSDG